MNFYIGFSNRKNSSSKVIINSFGEGKLYFNKNNFNNVLPNHVEINNFCINAFDILNLNIKEYNIYIEVCGGGKNSQIEASQLSVCRALCKIKFNAKYILKKNLILHNDCRIKERRKYGLKKARKKSQYSKR